MVKRLQGLVIGLIIGTLLTSGIVFGEQFTKNAELFFNNIKIYIDGAEIVPKDANGNKVEPFTMNGTTYLPVRAISNAFGKDVEWDGTTQSVYIGKKDKIKPDAYLHNLDYNDYKESDNRSNLTIVKNGIITDYDNKIYTNGLLFNINYWGEIENEEDTKVLISYPLNSQYLVLNGNIVIPKKYTTSIESEDKCSNAQTNVYIYGDNKLLYKAIGVTQSKAFNFNNLDVSGVNQLTIKIAPKSHTDIALTDLALYK